MDGRLVRPCKCTNMDFDMAVSVGWRGQIYDTSLRESGHEDCRRCDYTVHVRSFGKLVGSTTGIRYYDTIVSLSAVFCRVGPSKTPTQHICRVTQSSEKLCHMLRWRTAALRSDTRISESCQMKSQFYY